MNPPCTGYSSESYSQTIWQDIIAAHWNYLEVEENMEKLEKRQILEVQIRQLLFHVNQSRKFYVPVTHRVLGETVCGAKDFSVCGVMNGFEAVHQYANNLLTKPWRPEFKTIRTYSGFYKQEVERHLIDVELMFCAMGYRKMPDGTLMLKGPLCMDQVANVSRDALLAYVECQIMSEIFGMCIQHKCPIEWIDIYRIREQYSGNVNQAVQILTDRFRHQFNDPMQYPDIQQQSQCNLCGVQQYGPCTCSHNYSNGHFSHYRDEQLPQPPPPPSQTAIQNAYQLHGQHPPMHAFAHSKSVEYGDTSAQMSNGHNHVHGPNFHGNGRHSRSFDQHFDYNTYAPPTAFNVAGQRFPLPFNESQQFQQYSSQPPCTSAMQCDRNPYAPQVLPNGYHHDQNVPYGLHYPTLGQIPRTISDPTRIQQHDTYNNHRQMSLEHPPMHQHPSRKPSDDHRHSASNQHSTGSMSSYAQTVGSKSAVTQTTSNGTPADPFVSHHFDFTDNLTTPLVPQRARNNYDYEESSPNTNGSETSRGVSDFDSFDEAATQVGHYSTNSRSSSNRSPAYPAMQSAHNDINGNGHHRASLPSSNHREQEGVGSYEQWHGVYKEIKQNKPRVSVHQEQNNLSLEGLDLNQRLVSNRNHSSDKKLSRAEDKVALLSPPITRKQPAISTGMDARKRNDKISPETLKKYEAARIDYDKRTRSRTGTIERKSLPSGTPKDPPPATLTKSKQSQPPPPAKHTTPPTAKEVSARNEWSCSYCTLLNPMSIHICEACAKTKDLINIGVPKATTTCV